MRQRSGWGRLFALAACGVCWLNSSAAAQLAQKDLVPPGTVAVPRLPISSGPQVRPAPAPERLPLRLWAWPNAEFAREATVPAGEKQRGPWRYPTVDAPALTAEARPATPAAIVLPASPPAFVTSANSEKLPHLPRFARDAELPPKQTDDPGAAAGYRALTAAQPLPTPTPVPLLKLSVPDPFAYLQAVELRNPPAEIDRPAVTLVKPQPPVLSPPPPPATDAK